MKLWTVPAGNGAVSIVSRPLGDELLFGEMEEIRAAGSTSSSRCSTATTS